MTTSDLLASDIQPPNDAPAVCGPVRISIRVVVGWPDGSANLAGPLTACDSR